MKITKEELSKLDVKAYVEFIEQRYEQLEQAVEMLSGLELKMQQQGQQEKSRSENLSCNRQDLREPPRGKVIPQQKQQKKEKQESWMPDILLEAVAMSDPHFILPGIDELAPNYELELARHFNFSYIKWMLGIQRMLFDSSAMHAQKELDSRKRTDKGAAERMLKEAESQDFKYLEWILSGEIVFPQYVYDNRISMEFGRLYFLQQLAQEKPIPVPLEQPLRWSGKSAQLGYFMNAFAERGYLEAPRHKNGEINYKEFSRQLTKIFVYEGGREDYLAKCLNPNANPLSEANKEKIQIPHIKDIS